MRGEFIDVNGARLYYYAAGTRGIGEPVVFLHGFPTSSHFWTEVVPLVPKGHRVVVVDLFGYGRSDRPAGRDVSVEAMPNGSSGCSTRWRSTTRASSAMTWEEALRQTMAVRWPTRVSRLMLVNSVGFDLWPGREVKVARAMLPLTRHLPATWLLSILRTDLMRGYLTSDRGTHSIEMYVRPFASPGRSRRARRSHDVARQQRDESDRASAEGHRRSDGDLWGAEDPFLPVGIGRRLNAEIPWFLACGGARRAAFHARGGAGESGRCAWRAARAMTDVAAGNDARHGREKPDERARALRAGERGAQGTTLRGGGGAPARLPLVPRRTKATATVVSPKRSSSSVASTRRAPRSARASTRRSASAIPGWRTNSKHGWTSWRGSKMVAIRSSAILGSRSARRQASHRRPGHRCAARRSCRAWETGFASSRRPFATTAMSARVESLPRDSIMLDTAGVRRRLGFDTGPVLVEEFRRVTLPTSAIQADRHQHWQDAPQFDHQGHRDRRRSEARLSSAPRTCPRSIRRFPTFSTAPWSALLVGAVAGGVVGYLLGGEKWQSFYRAGVLPP